jgi:oxygen-independent coproporphyrinogen III oxidase
MKTSELLSKYNLAAPRYTSYPTVPYWDEEAPDNEQWLSALRFAFSQSNKEEGISLYIHLPFCESLCTYCGCNTRITVNHAVELPYIHALMNEWAIYLSTLEETPRIREIHLGGGTPTFFSPGHLRMLLESIQSSSIILPDAELSFEGHPNNTTFCHLQTLHQLGFRRVSFGIQDFDEKVQTIINRVQPYENVERVTRQARELGYSSINYDLVYGLPLQTLPSLSETIDKVIELKPHRIAFYSYAHVPWIKGGQRKFTEQDLPSPEEKLRLYQFGAQKLADAGYHNIGMDHFALPGDELLLASRNGTMHRNFMGYTTRSTKVLIGLGVSSISDCGYAFAQNAKTVEEYIGKINSGELAVFKGHVLNEDDLLIKSHILNIMCRHETQWGRAEQSQSYWPEILMRLKVLEEDGLITLQAQSLKVSKTGHNFLRNIAMAFDIKLHEREIQKKLFSAAV